jgi:hypothetical protein
MMRHAFAVVLALLLASGIPGAALGAGGCDPTPENAAAIAAARRVVEAGCACDGFPSHGRYVRCARLALRAEVDAGRLDRRCAAAVQAIYRQSTCSHAQPKVACCEENGRRGTRACTVKPAASCVSKGTTTRTACAAVAVCADTRCQHAEPPPACGPELLYGPEGNRLRRYDLDTVRQGPLVEDILIERASQGGLDINGQVCVLPDGSGRFVAGEDTGQPNPPPGWGVFAADGTQVGKLTATYFVAGAEPFGCAVDAAGRLFTSEVGNQASGPPNGQLIMWFPPYDQFPGPPGAYPNTNERSTNFCKLAADLGTAGSVAVDALGRVYVSAARENVVYRFVPPFPASVAECTGTDGLGSPLATNVTREVFASGIATVSGIVPAPNGNWFISGVLTGVIGEYDVNGTFLRQVLAPQPGESTLPFSVGHPQGLAVDCRGDLYYADLALRVSPSGSIGPGPNGSVRRVPFDVCGTPGAPEVVRNGLAFPDGLGIVAGDLEAP